VSESTITLRAADVSAAIGAARWWEAASLRRLLGGQPGRTLAHDFGPDPAAPAYAFLAADVTEGYAGALRIVRRFFVVLRGQAVISFDLASSPDLAARVLWTLDGTGLTHRQLLPSKKSYMGEDRRFLNVLQTAPGEIEPIVESVDLAGVRIGEHVVLFHTDTSMAQSSVYFDLTGKGKLQFLIVGLMPGFWEVWRDGYLEEDTGGMVKPEAGTLRFPGPAGNYYVRLRA
jgi:hypothetical protein